jgi:hypothetical protein
VPVRANGAALLGRLAPRLEGDIDNEALPKCDVGLVLARPRVGLVLEPGIDTVRRIVGSLLEYAKGNAPASLRQLWSMEPVWSSEKRNRESSLQSCQSSFAIAAFSKLTVSYNAEHSQFSMAIRFEDE